MRLFAWCVVVFWISAALGVAAQVSNNLEQALHTEFQDKTLLIRGFPSDDRLSFDADLKPTSTIHPGSWTLAEIEIREIQLKQDLITLSGNRIGFAYDSKSKKLTKLRLDQRIQIQIKGPFTFPPEQVLRDISNRVFVTDANEISALVPNYWKSYLTGEVITTTEDGTTHYSLKKYAVHQPVGGSGSQSDGVGQLPGGEPLYRVLKNNDVKPPKPRRTPDPHYSKLARLARFEGKSILVAVIGITGGVGEINIAQPAGLGLDEAAISAVQSWKFDPASKNGQPVFCQINVEVNFRLY